MSKGYSETYNEEIRRVWETKPILRKVLQHHYKQILNHASPGNILELGAGVGTFKEMNRKRIYATDIDKNKWIDAKSDMTKLTFPANSFSNIACINAFHHLNKKDWNNFFESTYRILKPKGRLILFEPHNSFFSVIIRKIFHKSKDRYPNAYDSNIEKFPTCDDITNSLKTSKFRIIKIDYLDILVYPLSGGFYNKSLMPMWSYSFFRSFDYILYPFKKWLAFKFMIVLEKGHNNE